MLFRLNLGVLLGTLILIVLPSALQAQVYRWEDDQGRVHYGDKPPAGKKGESTQVELREQSDRRWSGAMNTPRVGTAKPILYTGTQKPRLLWLEKVVVSLKYEEGEPNIVGYNFEGEGCNKKSDGGIVWSGGRSTRTRPLLEGEFIGLLKRYNYAVVDERDRVFAGQARESADLHIAAVITEMKINSCRPSRQKPDTKIASFMEVEWKVFDPLDREIVFETQTAGSDQFTEASVVPNDVERAQSATFHNAVLNLLAQREFVDLLTQSRRAYQPSEVIKDIEVKLAYGEEEHAFVDVVDSLKQATVTVRSPAGHGSGFIVSADGYLITNAHVVGEAKEALVFVGERKLRARVLSRHAKRDVALLKVSAAQSLPVLKISEKKIGSGHDVYIIGTPLDESLSHTVTRGIISAERLMEDGQRYYQTDAAINPGNSGGPAFDRNGEVIGIAEAGIFSKAGGSMNINFLIPIEEAIAVLGLD